jgi:hypothetical protein
MSWCSLLPTSTFHRALRLCQPSLAARSALRNDFWALGSLPAMSFVVIHFIWRWIPLRLSNRLGKTLLTSIARLPTATRGSQEGAFRAAEVLTLAKRNSKQIVAAALSASEANHFPEFRNPGSPGHAPNTEVSGTPSRPICDPKGMPFRSRALPFSRGNLLALCRKKLRGGELNA